MNRPAQGWLPRQCPTPEPRATAGPRDVWSGGKRPRTPPGSTRRWLAAVGVLASLGLNAPAAAPERVVIRPRDTGVALVNPGMGWTFHFYSNIIKNYGSKLEPWDTLEDWPGLSVIYLRVPWSFLEPKEGEFNWSLFDTPAQRWIARGKRIAIRVSCSESWLRFATPRWVQAAGAQGVDFEFGKGPKPGAPLWDPDYLDPVFLQKLESFLAAMARRYDGNPNVAFIDIGSFGMWGEGHTGFSSRLNEEQTLAVVRRHIDLHAKHFAKTLLCLSDDVAGPSQPGRHFPAMDYALAKGVTMRDDSILVQPPPNSWYHAEMAQEFWPRLPVILEHEHYGGSKQRGAWSGGPAGPVSRRLPRQLHVHPLVAPRGTDREPRDRGPHQPPPGLSHPVAGDRLAFHRALGTARDRAHRVG